jgi:Acetyltransferase (GNAT) domain
MITMRQTDIEQDFLITDLPQSILEKLNFLDTPWLNSHPFCMGYGTHAAERVWIKQNMVQTLHQAESMTEGVEKVVFYRIDKGFFLKKIDILGFPDVEDVIIEGLIKKHKAHLAIVNRTEKAVEPEENWQPPKSNIYVHDYITIVDLPKTKEEYLKQLGKNRRKQLPQWTRRTYRYFNEEIEMRCDFKEAIKLEDTIKLEYLNSKRRASKGKGVDPLKVIEDRQRHIYPLFQSFGMLLTVRHKGEILGGNLSFLHDNNCYMVVTGHNPDYEELRIGNIAIFATINYLIDNGYDTLNFLWGRKPYKTQFLGIEYPWSVHLISPYAMLPIFWKYKTAVEKFWMRGWRFLMTRLGFNQ